MLIILLYLPVYTSSVFNLPSLP